MSVKLTKMEKRICAVIRENSDFPEWMGDEILRSVHKKNVEWYVIGFKLYVTDLKADFLRILKKTGGSPTSPKNDGE